MSQAFPTFPVVAFSPAGWTVEAATEDDFGDASPWDDLGEWQGLEVFDSAGRQFTAVRAFRLRPRSSLGLWVCRLLFRQAVRVGFEWGPPREVALRDLLQRLRAGYPADWFDEAINNHEGLIRRCL